MGFFEAEEEDEAVVVGLFAEAVLKLLRKLKESFKRLWLRSLAALFARAVAIFGFRFVLSLYISVSEPRATAKRKSLRFYFILE